MMNDTVYRRDGMRDRIDPILQPEKGMKRAK
jgi:hypothetical protein